MTTRTRAPFAALLALTFVALAAAQDPKKDPDPKEAKTPEFKWPTDVNGKDINAVMKDMESNDPLIREFAANTLPLFGPPAQKGEVSKLLLKRMSVEKDPGVRSAVYNAVGQISFDSPADNKEALRLLVQVVGGNAPGGTPGSITRLNAVQTIAAFGPKAEGAITVLTGTVVADPSYSTRQSVARTLAHIGFNETTGPNMKALTALADRLAYDECAAVRMEALQGLVKLGPPWAEVRKKDDKTPVVIKTADSAIICKFMRARIGDPKAKLQPLEKDKQVEIWARLVLMRFDPKEVNEENLDAFAKFLTGAEVGVKAQALNALAMLGEGASKKVLDIMRLIENKGENVQVQFAAVNALGAIGAGAKEALPPLRKLLAETKAELPKKKDQEKEVAEEMIKLLERVIKHIDEAKPMSPAGSEPKKP
jgi:HEAT repeat protein